MTRPIEVTIRQVINPIRNGSLFINSGHSLNARTGKAIKTKRGANNVFKNFTILI